MSKAGLPRLSAKSATVLALIAQGHSYSQIVDSNPDISYLDIFKAAEEALRLTASQSGYQQRLAGIKSLHPRAYEPWTDDEDANLTSMHQQREPADEIARRLQRQPSAIRSRLSKLALDPRGSVRSGN